MSNLRPIINLNRGFTVHGEHEVYTGPNGAGQICPNVNDMVWSWSVGPMRCISLDVNTGLSVLEPWKAPEDNKDAEGLDILLGNGGHAPNEYYMLHVDNSVKPATLTADAKLRMYRKDVDHIKYFLGSDVVETGVVISKKYDGSGNWVNDEVDLEVLQVEEPNVRTVVTPRTSHTTHTVKSGDFVTAVAYNEQGGAISRTKLIVHETALFAKGLNTARYVAAINLKSPWMRNDGNVLDIPINLPVSSLGLMGEVVYNNGDVVEYPIDGTRFSLYGLDNYIASVPDYNNPLVLSYLLDENEVSTSQSSTGSNHETKAYTIHTLPAKHEYNLKLYVYPHWDGNGWILKYKLANLSRDVIIDVTDKVVYGEEGISTFNPTLWGIEQNFTVSIRLDEVNAAYAPYRHVQTFKVTLFGPPKTTDNPSWLVHYEDAGDDAYGVKVCAKQVLVSINDYAFDLSSGCNSTDEWLRYAYRAIEPLYDQEVESSAPNPTHFDVTVNGTTKRYPVELWQTKVNFPTNLHTGALVDITWVMETEHQDLYLGTSGFMVKAL